MDLFFFLVDAYANLLLVFRVEVVLSFLTGIGAVGDLCRYLSPEQLYISTSSIYVQLLHLYI